MLEIVYSKPLTLKKRKQVQRGAVYEKVRQDWNSALLDADSPAHAKLLPWTGAP